MRSIRKKDVKRLLVASHRAADSAEISEVDVAQMSGQIRQFVDSELTSDEVANAS